MNGDSRRRRIAERAYAIWEREGRVHGRDVRHWLQAEHEILEIERDRPLSDPYSVIAPAPERARQPTTGITT